MWKQQRKRSNGIRDKQKEKEERHIILATWWMDNRTSTMVLLNLTDANRQDIQTKKI